MALTQEIVVIQGPPGTGKTYIGYKIVQTLLENREVWDPNRNSPILVMCFTNHSLDQFLEGIIHHELSDSETEGIRWPKIVRIGGRSQSEEIQRHSLRNVRRRFVPRELYRSVCAKRGTCSALGSSIEWSSSQLQNIVHNPVSDEIIGHNGINKLKRFIHPSHLYQIKINVSRILHQCCHEVRMKCCDDPSTFQCYCPCEKRISRCGHKCQSKCSQPCTPSNLCQEIVPQRLPCGHKMNVFCSADQKSIVCPEPCKKLLDTCGHGCEGTCRSCSQGRLHAQCKKECGRDLNCGHICNFPCPEFCPPCDKPCKMYHDFFFTFLVILNCFLLKLMLNLYSQFFIKVDRIAYFTLTPQLYSLDIKRKHTLNRALYIIHRVN